MRRSHWDHLRTNHMCVPALSVMAIAVLPVVCIVRDAWKYVQVESDAVLLGVFKCPTSPALVVKKVEICLVFSNAIPDHYLHGLRFC